MESMVKRIGKKLQYGFIIKTNTKNIIGPVYHNTTINHNTKYGEINPMKPTGSQGMLFNNFFHRKCYFKYCIAAGYIYKPFTNIFLK